MEFIFSGFAERNHSFLIQNLFSVFIIRRFLNQIAFFISFLIIYGRLYLLYSVIESRHQLQVLSKYTLLFMEFYSCMGARVNF